MSIEKPELEQSSPEYQSVEQIALKKAVSGDKNAIEISVPSKLPKEELEALVREKLVRENWWLKKEWQEKGLPQEQFDIEVGEGKIILYNFGLPLEDKHIEELQRAVADFSKIKVGSEKKIKYILINNERRMNPHTTEEQRGDGSYIDSAMLIYPKGTDSGDYRAEETKSFNGISNFEGTVIHELAHLIGTDFINKWAKKFHWKYLKEAKELAGGSLTVFEPEEPERCVSNYAQVNPAEDICESVVAALRNPDVLDPEKLKFIQGGLFKDEEPLQVALKKRAADGIELPKIDSEVSYRVKKSSIKIRKRT